MKFGTEENIREWIQNYNSAVTCIPMDLKIKSQPVARKYMFLCQGFCNLTQLVLYLRRMKLLICREAYD